MNESSVWLDLDQITARLRVVTSEQLGLKLDEVKPESRLIEDLNCDSLDLVELVMETKDEFGITIPETPASPVGKLIFTRQPFRIRDLAEFAFLNQGTGKPIRSGWRKKPIELPAAAESSFTQLGGRFNSVELWNVNLYEKLDAPVNLPKLQRVVAGSATDVQHPLDLRRQSPPLAVGVKRHHRLQIVMRFIVYYSIPVLFHYRLKTNPILRQRFAELERPSVWRNG